MKKLLSVLLTVAMLMSLVTIPASAATTVAKEYISNTTGSGVNNQTSATTVKGVMGRGADDTSTYVSRIRPQSEIDNNNTANHKFQFIASTGTDDAGYGDLTVLSVSFAVQKYMSSVLLTGNGGVNISTIMSLDDAKIQKGWNKLVYVYDHSTAGDELGEKAGQWAMYLNGECINAMGDNVIEMKADNPFSYISKGKMHQLRIMFGSSHTSQEIGMYFDDAHIYTVNTDDKAAVLASFEQTAPSLAPATNSEYAIEGSMITVQNGTKASALKASGGAEVKVFMNDEYAFELGNDEALEDGNVIVVSKDGLFTYYKVGAPGAVDNTIYSTKFTGGSYDSGFTLANSGFFTAEYVTGKAGKQASDTSLNFKRAGVEGETSGWMGNNIYTYIFAPIDKPAKKCQ